MVFFDYFTAYSYPLFLAGQKEMLTLAEVKMHLHPLTQSREEVEHTPCLLLLLLRYHEQEILSDDVYLEMAL